MTKLTRLNYPRSVTQTQLYDLQQRYEILNEQEKQRVNEYLLNIYEILGIEPGSQLEEGQNYFQLLQFLFTNVNDHTLRIGRIEQVLEKILVQMSTQSDTTTVTKSGHTEKNIVSTHGLEMWTDAEGNLIDSESVTDRSLSMRRESDSVTDRSTHRSYGEIRYLRGIYPGMKVKEFCAKFGVDEQAFYRAMRKGK